MHTAHHFTELRVPEGSVKPNKIPLHTVVLQKKIITNGYITFWWIETENSFV